MIKNPFESGHIKNYILLYASVVVIMMLFFVATTLFNDIKEVDKKVFETEVKEKVQPKDAVVKDMNKTKKFKLMESTY